jgi:putative ABC transport system substrate-binding protein
MIGRRAMLALGATLLAEASLAQGARPRRIGIVRLSARPQAGDIQIAGLVEAFRALGLAEGSAILTENRFADGDLARLPALMDELLASGVDVIVAVGTAATDAARRATASVPIVAFANVDPVAAGLADQLGRPTGNVTGVLIAPDGTLAAKRLALLREAVPLASRFALLAPANDPFFALQIRETEAAAAALGVALAVVPVRPDGYGAAFEVIARGGAQALVVGSHQFFVRDRRTIIAAVERLRLPAMYEWRHQVEDGGMMSFGADVRERYARLAAYVDRILKGARPADLPFEQPAALRLIVNIKAARAIGLELPPGFLARADEVIE